MQKKNGSRQSGMMLKAFFSMKRFAQANRKISAYTQKAQDEFYEMNLRFPKKSFMFLAGIGRMINQFETGKRQYPLMIGCGQFDIPGEAENIKQWKSTEPDCEAVIFPNAGHCVNMDVPQEFNRAIGDFWERNK